MSREYPDRTSLGRESVFTLEQKLKHIRAAWEKKIEAIQKEIGRILSDEEKAAITLTEKEYDQYRDKQNSLAGGSISYVHTWTYALEKAGIAPTKKKRLKRDPS